MATTHVSRLEVGPANRALVIVALGVNALVLVLVALDGFADVPYALALCGPPAVVLAVQRHPRTFRALAALLGALLAVWGVAGLWFGGWVMMPAAVLLLWAALVPWIDPAHPWRRRAWLAAAAASTVLAPIVAPWVWILLLR